MSPMPIVTLSNGIRVGNFSSNHPFEFEDGTILPACKSDRFVAGAAAPQESAESRRTDSGIDYEEVTLTPRVTLLCQEMLEDTYEQCYGTVPGDGPDVAPVCDLVIIPRMLMEAVQWFRNHVAVDDGIWPFLVVIKRRGRGGPICIDRFCV